MRNAYMDYSAGASIDPRVAEAMQPYFTERIGNPSSVHSLGQEAKGVIKDARAKVAELIGASEREIIFTSSGTESNNLALLGTVYRNEGKGNHIITTTIEHMSVLNPLKFLQKRGFETTHIPVDEYGLVDVDKIREAITDKTILVSVMYANGEIGTIEPIRDVGDICREKGIYLHVDGVVAAGKVDIDVERDNIDLLSLSSNDIYGPRGVGALYIRKGVAINPIILGGGQERGLRSATENVGGIVGFGKAAEIAKKEMKDEARRLSKFRDNLIKGVLEGIPHSYLNGHPTNRLCNNAALRFSYVEGEGMLLHLDMAGIYVSTGSACTSKTLEPSHVLRAIGLAHEDAHGSLLFTLGRWSTSEDVEYVLETLPGVVEKLRAMSPFTPPELKS
ncbi:MAG: aminotransferase class V-fold PLP-dependent enzyme [Candidatus Hydrothermarchaeales archaeon]